MDKEITQLCFDLEKCGGEYVVLYGGPQRGMSLPVTELEMELLKESTEKEEKIKKDKAKEHHIWCNFFMNPVEDCWMCNGLYKTYPMDVPPEEMMKKYFPGNIERK